MDVILVVVYLFENNRRIMLGDFRQLDIKVGKDSLVEHRPSVFSAYHDMVIALIDTMRQSFDLHRLDSSPTIPEKNAGRTSSHDLTVGDLSSVG